MPHPHHQMHVIADLHLKMQDRLDCPGGVVDLLDIPLDTLSHPLQGQIPLWMPLLAHHRSIHPGILWHWRQDIQSVQQTTP